MILKTERQTMGGPSMLNIKVSYNYIYIYTAMYIKTTQSLILEIFRLMRNLIPSIFLHFVLTNFKYQGLKKFCIHLKLLKTFTV